MSVNIVSSHGDDHRFRPHCGKKRITRGILRAVMARDQKIHFRESILSQEHFLSASGPVSGEQYITLFCIKQDAEAVFIV